MPPGTSAMNNAGAARAWAMQQFTQQQQQQQFQEQLGDMPPSFPPHMQGGTEYDVYNTFGMGSEDQGMGQPQNWGQANMAMAQQLAQQWAAAAAVAEHPPQSVESSWPSMGFNGTQGLGQGNWSGMVGDASTMPGMWPANMADLARAAEAAAAAAAIAAASAHAVSGGGPLNLPSHTENSVGTSPLWHQSFQDAHERSGEMAEQQPRMQQQQWAAAQQQVQQQAQQRMMQEAQQQEQQQAEVATAPVVEATVIARTSVENDQDGLSASLATEDAVLTQDISSAVADFLSGNLMEEDDEEDDDDDGSYPKGGAEANQEQAASYVSGGWGGGAPPQQGPPPFGPAPTGSLSHPSSPPQVQPYRESGSSQQSWIPNEWPATGIEDAGAREEEDDDEDYEDGEEDSLESGVVVGQQSDGIVVSGRHWLLANAGNLEQRQLLEPGFKSGDDLANRLRELPLPPAVAMERLPRLHCVISSCISGFYRERRRPALTTLQQRLRARGMDEAVVVMVLTLCALESDRYTIWVGPDGQPCLLLNDEPLEDANLGEEGPSLEGDVYNQELLEKNANKHVASAMETVGTLHQYAGSIPVPPAALQSPPPSEHFNLAAAVEASGAPRRILEPGVVPGPQPGPNGPAPGLESALDWPQMSEKQAKKRGSARPDPHSNANSAMALAATLQAQRVTTLMLRNLPQSVTQKRVIEELTNSGFAGLYDFCYMPSTFSSGVGKGYAFLNLTSAAALGAFVNEWHGSRRFNISSSEPPLNVSVAALQGRAANAKKWDAPRMKRVRNPALRPLVIEIANGGRTDASEAPSNQGLPAGPVTGERRPRQAPAERDAAPPGLSSPGPCLQPAQAQPPGVVGATATSSERGFLAAATGPATPGRWGASGLPDRGPR